MAETVLIPDSTATAKIRHPLKAFGLVFLTLGVYHFVWYYKINRELRDLGRATGEEDRLGRSPGKSLLAMTLGWLAIIPPFVSFYRTMQRVEVAQELRGTAQRANAGLGFGLFAVGLFTLPVEIVYVQGELNRVWRDETAPAPAALATA